MRYGAEMQLKIENLAVSARVGVHEWEREKAQNIVINLLLDFDSGAAPTTDLITDTLDYSILEAHVVQIVEAKHYNLLEHMVEMVGQSLISMPGIREVRVEVVKPGALKHAPAVSISEVYRA